MSDRPAPLVPAEVDLRDFPGMWVDTDRLLRSDTWMLGSSDEKAAAFTLWAEAWHQVPAASLPNNDRMLSKLSQAEKWKASREHALRGWVLCSDDRLYHPVVAEKALEAWIKKLAAAISGAVGNSKRWNIAVDTTLLRTQFRAAVDCLRTLNPASRVLKEKAVAVILAGSGGESGGDSRPESGGDADATSGGDRKGSDQTRPDHRNTSPPAPIEGRAGDNPPGTAEPSPYAAVCIALKAAGMQAVNPSHPVLRALVDAGAEPAEFVAAAARADGKDDPFAYVLAIVKGDRKRAAETAGVIHRGPLRVIGKQTAIEEANRRAGEEWLAQQEPTDASR